MSADCSKQIVNVTGEESKIYFVKRRWSETSLQRNVAGPNPDRPIVTRTTLTISFKKRQPKNVPNIYFEYKDSRLLIHIPKTFHANGALFRSS